MCPVQLDPRGLQVKAAANALLLACLASRGMCGPRGGGCYMPCCCPTHAQGRVYKLRTALCTPQPWQH